MKQVLLIGMLAGSDLIASAALAQTHDTHAHATQRAQQTRSEASASDDDAATDHSGMDHSRMDHSTMIHSQMDRSTKSIPPVDNPERPITPIPHLSDADRAAARPPATTHDMHSHQIQHWLQFNRLEWADAESGSALAWEAQAWIGSDDNRLWLRSEGERGSEGTENAQLELLYGRPITRWWDAVAGIRHDFNPGSTQSFAAIGIQGTMPYKFESSATAYIGESRQTALNLEVEYDTLLSNRLILQSLFEAEAYGQTDSQRMIGSGLNRIETGLRLRYEIRREFAPYIGISHRRHFGQTADWMRAAGEPSKDTHWVAGVRFWF